MKYVPLDIYVKQRTRPILLCMVILDLICLWAGAHPGAIVLLVVGEAVFFSHLKNSRFPKSWSESIGSMIKSSRETDEEMFKSAVSKHLPVLARKRNAYITKDDYGNLIFDKWFKEEEYYLSKLNYTPHSTEYYSGMDELEQKLLLDEMIDEYIDGCDLSVDYSDDFSPDEYEQYCSDVLSGIGWDSRVTKGSGDQGVDVIASKDGVTVAIQCKKYASPVGNKAVQEVIAGKGYYGADIGLVVTNNTYTPSARRLAQSHQIHLLHHDDLYNIDSLIYV
ncbi:restriction endonuclease [Serratia rubidaea]|uniref:restriction endonuclease n=1 Tax=Serratia rubidaea TaxID=61652 RepID=UPI00177CAC06|nr:restriction endonuclease [Serratia rubidaea]MBD8451887.1 restriction endonuclease [Serratia rubidaea]